MVTDTLTRSRCLIKNKFKFLVVLHEISYSYIVTQDANF